MHLDVSDAGPTLVRKIRQTLRVIGLVGHVVAAEGMAAYSEGVRQVSADSVEGGGFGARGPPPTVCLSLGVADLSEAELRSVCDLWTAAFPTPATRDRYAEAVARRATSDARDEEIHAIFASDGSCLAAARSFVRTVEVGDADGENAEERDVLALAHVATAPAARGRGLGVRVVKSAWERLGRDGDGVEESLFCSGVPAFYEKLGAVALKPLAIAYPSETSKRFADPTMLRAATRRSRPWPDVAGLRFVTNGDGW